MLDKIVIFVPFFEDFTPKCGSSIRIAGYTEGLEYLNIDYKFLANRKPDYVPVEKFERLPMTRRWTKFLLIHNLLFASKWTRFFSFFIRIIINRIAELKKIENRIGGRTIWAHQETTLAMYFHYTFRRKFIYDIHGFFDIQREYRDGLNLWRKLWFDLYLRNERVVLQTAPLINVVSSRMKEFVENNFNPSGKIYIAPDGIPGTLTEYDEISPNYSFKIENKISNDDKIILFAGSFKKIGGVQELVNLFLETRSINSKAILLLIGDGQMEDYITDQLKKSDLKLRVFHFRPIEHIKLISFLKLADVIVCPDLEDNAYNQMTPHIKLYDAIASGSNVVATDFSVNREIFNPIDIHIFYFSEAVEDSFKNAVQRALSCEKREYLPDKLIPLTYLSQVKSYVQQFGN
jgi:glycosyltransferase involved in cell wall biosynthesis